MTFPHEAAVARARQRARRLYANGSFRSAYVAGVVAALGGSTETACPYKRTYGWSAAYAAAWKRGHRSVRP